MTRDQVIILIIMVGYLVFNVVVGMVLAKRKDSKSTLSAEKKYFIGSRDMNGLVLAMTTVATYTSVSSFISGPGAAGLKYGYASCVRGDLFVFSRRCGAGWPGCRSRRDGSPRGRCPHGP